MLKIRFNPPDLFFTILLIIGVSVIGYQRIYELFITHKNRKYGRIVFRWTTFSIFISYILICIGALAEYFVVGRKINFTVVSLGLILYIAASIIRRHCIKILGVYHSMFIEFVEDHKVIKQGPYKYLRHPYYAAIFIELIGLTLLVNSYYATLSVFILFIPILILRIFLEEKWLVRNLGKNYLDYQKDTPIIPTPNLIKRFGIQSSYGRRVVITGIGIIAPNGIGKEDFWLAIQKGKSGIKRIKSFDASKFPVQIAGEIQNINLDDFLNSKEVRRMDRFTQLGVTAALMAVKDAKLEINRENSERIGVTIGTSLAGLGFGEEQYKIFKERGLERVSPFLITALITSDCPSQISMELGIRGPSLTISTACSSSSDAIGTAFNYIRNGEVDIIISGGAEAPITPLALAGFIQGGVLSKRNDEPEKASRPFDKDRDGMVISEGAGILILEELNHALKRNANIYAELVGYGRSCDAYHIVQPLPTGKEAERAIRMALQDAHILPQEVDYINAHGSSTILNDKIETFVIKNVFGKHAYNLVVSSTKSMTGHLQGACGAIELIVCTLAIRDNVLPPTINYEEPDPDCDLNYVPNKARNAKVNIALSNTFGFGGKNSALLVKKFK